MTCIIGLVENGKVFMGGDSGDCLMRRYYEMTWKEWWPDEGKWATGRRTFDTAEEAFGSFRPNNRWYPLEVKDVVIEEVTAIEVVNTETGCD